MDLLDHRWFRCINTNFVEDEMQAAEQLWVEQVAVHILRHPLVDDLETEHSIESEHKMDCHPRKRQEKLKMHESGDTCSYMRCLYFLKTFFSLPCFLKMWQCLIQMCENEDEGKK